MITDKSGQQVGFTFVDDSTAIAVLGDAAATKDSIKKVAAGGSGLKSSQVFVELYNKIDTKQSLWFLANGNSPMFQKMGAMGVKPKAIFGSANVTDGLTFDMRMRLNSPDEATNLVKMAQGQTSSPQVKEMFDKLDINNDGADFKVSIALGVEKLKKLADMLKGFAAMAGGMGGGMGGP
jgi:hypothetical protein